MGVPGSGGWWWWGLWVANLGGSEGRNAVWPVTSNLLLNQPQPHIYTLRLTLCSVWGQGRGYFRVWGRGGVRQRQNGGGAGAVGGRGEEGQAFHSLKPEWDLSMLYGLLHTSVRQGEFESFTEQPPPLGTAVKVKVSTPTHTSTITHTHTLWPQHIHPWIMLLSFYAAKMTLVSHTGFRRGGVGGWNQSPDIIRLRVQVDESEEPN